MSLKGFQNCNNATNRLMVYNPKHYAEGFRPNEHLRKKNIPFIDGVHQFVLDVSPYPFISKYAGDTIQTK